MTARVRKAVFPVAGLGTRFLPATKAIPKEMLTRQLSSAGRAAGAPRRRRGRERRSGLRVP